MERKEPGLSEGFSRPWLPFAVVAVLGSYLWFHFQYPFYFIWDMDHTVLVDTILIQSGKWPVHLHHPGFGMYLPLKWSHLISYWLGFTSILNLDDLKNSVGPLLGVAELASYLRFNSPFVAFGIGFMLWRVLVGLFSLRRTEEVLFFALCTLHSAFFYQSAMIRTELFAAFYWSLAIFAFMRSSLALSGRAESFWLFVAGFCLSLSQLSKVQALIYIGASLLLLEIFRRQNGVRRAANAWIQPHQRFLSRVNFGFAIYLIIGAALRRSYGATFTDSYPINFVGVSFLTVNFFAFLLANGGLKWIRRKLGDSVEEWLSITLLVMSGYLLAYLTHFLMYSDLATSYRYMLLDAKMIFFRNNFDPDIKIFSHFENLKIFILRNPLLYLCFGLAFSWGFFKRRFSSKIAVIFAILICFLSLFYGARPFLRDLIWAEMLVLFLLLWAAGDLLRNRNNLILVRVILFSALAGNLIGVFRIRSDADANYNLYGWAGQRLFDGTYYQGHLLFAPALHEAYGKENSKERKDAFFQATSFQWVRRAAEFSLANVSVDMKMLGLCEVGQPVFSKEKEVRFLKIPEELRGGVQADTREARLNPRIVFKSKLVNEHSELIDKRDTGGSDGLYSLLRRQDLEIFLVSEKDLSPSFKASVLFPVGELVVSTAAGPINLRAYRLEVSTTIPRNALGARHFFVIKQKFPT